MVTIGTARLRQLFYKTRGGELFRDVGNVRQVKTLIGKGDNCKAFLGRLLVCVDGDHERNYVGFTTAVGEVLMAECAATATELLIMDGTFKTNVEGYELLALMGMAHQRAYPLAYMLLAAGQKRERDRTDAITHFLREFANAFPASPAPNPTSDTTLSAVDPLFCLTDKDAGQINAYESAFPEAVVQLCQFHVLKAIRTWILSGAGNEGQKIDVASLRRVNTSVQQTMGDDFPTMWPLVVLGASSIRPVKRYRLCVRGVFFLAPWRTHDCYAATFRL